MKKSRDTKSAFIRADGSIQLGMGHIMRCLALAHVLRDGGWEISFVCKTYHKGPQQLIEEAGFGFLGLDTELDEASEIAIMESLIDDFKPKALVIDNRELGPYYCEQLSASGLKTLVFDDRAEELFPANIVLNQNCGKTMPDYSALPKTQMLVGAQYCILREEFREAREEAEKIFSLPPSKILITMGQSDADNSAGLLLGALEACEEKLQIKILAGLLNPNIEALRQMASQSRHDVELIPFSNQVSKLMLWADVGICGGGTTNWEFCCLGLPFLILTLVPYQLAIDKSLENSGAALSLGEPETLEPAAFVAILLSLLCDPARLKKMSFAGRALVDGRGIFRIASALESLYS